MIKAEIAIGVAQLAARSIGTSIRFLEEITAASKGATATAIEPLAASTAKEAVTVTASKTAKEAVATSRSADVATNTNAISKAEAVLFKKGEEVSFSHQGQVIEGEILKYQKFVDGDIAALVKVKDPGRLATKQPGQYLDQITPSLWKDETGAVFKTTQPVTELGTPTKSSLQFNPDLVVVGKENLRRAAGQELSAAAPALVSVPTDTLILRNASNPVALLDSLSTAPRIAFDGTLTPRATVFNPFAGTTNCMSCTAAVTRTLNSGKLVRADDIAKIRLPDGTSVGYPFVGRFTSEIDSVRWFEQASGTKVDRYATQFSELHPERQFAAKINMPSREADLKHMIFGYKFNSGKVLLYDGQAGVQYSATAMEKYPKIFMQLKPSLER